MKLRLTGAGFETFTGQMGVLEFVDGLSTGRCSPIDATRIAGIIGADWEDGTPANVSQIYLDCRDVGAPMVNSGEAIPAPEATPVIVAPEIKPTVAKIFTEDDLAAIADAKGISGLREIADPMGIKGTSIVSLISSILTVMAESRG